MRTSSLSWSIGAKSAGLTLAAPSPSSGSSTAVCSAASVSAWTGTHLKSSPLAKLSLADGRLQPDLTEELDGARGEAPRPRVDQEIGVTLDQQRREALPGQKERGGEAGEAASDDEHRRRFRRSCALRGSV